MMIYNRKKKTSDDLRLHVSSLYNIVRAYLKPFWTRAAIRLSKAFSISLSKLQAFLQKSSVNFRYLKQQKPDFFYTASLTMAAACLAIAVISAYFSGAFSFNEYAAKHSAEEQFAKTTTFTFDPNTQVKNPADSQTKQNLKESRFISSGQFQSSEQNKTQKPIKQSYEVAALTQSITDVSPKQQNKLASLASEAQSKVQDQTSEQNNKKGRATGEQTQDVKKVKEVKKAKLNDKRQNISLENTSQPPLYRLNVDGKTSLIRVTLNKSQTIRIDKSYSTALVGNSEIADVVPLSENLIYILGKQVGLTRLSILDKEKKMIGIIEVEVSYDIASLRRQIRKIVPRARVQVQSISGRIFLTGVVPDSVALQRIIRIARQNAPANAITNAINVSSPQQVMLEVRFVEATREASKELGVGWNVIADRFVGATLLGALPATGAAGLGTNLLSSGLTSGNAPFGSAVARLLDNGVTADLIIQSLETKGLAKRLAEPNLVALSGETAKFLAGGEFPFQVQAGDGVITNEFRRFGVGLSFTPTVLDDGLINLKIEPEVSDLVPTSGAVPALSVRRVETTVELRDGQSFAIAGLLEKDNFRNQNQLPWVGNLPVIGALFRSSSFQKNETDLVIIITPRLVKPVAPGNRLLTPLDKSVETNDMEFFLKGRLEKFATKPDEIYGHLLNEEEQGISQTQDRLEEDMVYKNKTHNADNVEEAHSIMPKQLMRQKPIGQHGHDFNLK